MKLTIFLSCAVLAFLAAPVLADEPVADIDKLIEKMKTGLDLTKEQIEDIKPILKEYNKEIKDARRDKEDDLGEVLSEVQMEKYRSIKAEKSSEAVK